jgi:hypothetical protein
MVEMRKRTLLIALAVIALGLIGTELSTLYKQNEYIGIGGPLHNPLGTIKTSYGFPLGYYGYSIDEYDLRIHGPQIYWFSLGSLLLDAAFWFAISSIGCISIIKSMNIFHKTRASKKLSVINM